MDNSLAVTEYNGLKCPGVGAGGFKLPEADVLGRFGLRHGPRLASGRFNTHSVVFLTAKIWISHEPQPFGAEDEVG